MSGTGRPGPESRLGRLYNALDDGGREVFDMLMHDGSWAETPLADALTALAEQKGIDVRITRNQVAYWRRGQARPPEAEAA